MNRRPPILKLSKALTGFLQYKAAEGLSLRTLEIYEQHLKQWLELDIGLRASELCALKIGDVDAKTGVGLDHVCAIDKSIVMDYGKAAATHRADLLLQSTNERHEIKYRS